MAERQHGVGLAAAELRGQVEYRRGLDFDAGEPPNSKRRQFGQIFRQESAIKEPGRLLIIGRRTVVAHMVEVDSKFRGVEGATVSEVFAWGNDLVPRFEYHKNSPD